MRWLLVLLIMLPATLVAYGEPASFQVHFFFDQEDVPATVHGFASGPIAGHYDEALRYYDAGNFKAALREFQAAQIFSHREFGVLNPYQLSIVDWIIECLYRAGDYEQITTQQRFYHWIVTKNFDPLSPEVLHTTIRLARWNRAMNHFEDALFGFEDAEDLLKTIPTTELSSEAYQLGMRPQGSSERVLYSSIQRDADRVATLMFAVNNNEHEAW